MFQSQVDEATRMFASEIENTLRASFGQNYGEVVAILLVALLIFAIIAFILFIIDKVGDFFIFKKVGEPPHRCFIPYYSSYMSYSYAGIPLVYFVMWLLPIVYYFVYYLSARNTSSNVTSIVSIVYLVVVIVIQAFKCFKISKKFGHGVGWAIGLFFLWPFFKLALALGQSQYNKDA